MSITLPTHQNQEKATTKATIITTRRPTPPPQTRRPSIRPRPTFRKSSPKFRMTTITSITTTEAPKDNHRRCPTFSEFKIGAVILWENLKQVNNIFGGIHVVVEAMVQAAKSLGLCFFLISSEVVEAIKNFFSADQVSEIDPLQNDPERNFLNSSRM